MLVQSQKRITNQLREIHTSEDIVTAAPISCSKHHNVATLAAALLYLPNPALLMCKPCGIALALIAYLACGYFDSAGPLSDQVVVHRASIGCN
jgi:hypothetical protein